MGTFTLIMLKFDFELLVNSIATVTLVAKTGKGSNHTLDAMSFSIPKGQPHYLLFVRLHCTGSKRLGVVNFQRIHVSHCGKTDSMKYQREGREKR